MTLNVTPPPDTLGRALVCASQKLAHSSDSPRLDAEILLAFCLGRDRSHLRAWPDKLLTAAQSAQFWPLVSHRANGIPIAYLTGEKEFWSRSFTVGPGVLIPRPETETLIERALDAIPPGTAGNILDLGTGSGAIAITLAVERPATAVLAVDKCPEALAIARSNIQRHNVTNIELRQSDWFSAIPTQSTFDLIVSNPPYLATEDPHLQRDGVRHEPLGALVAGPEGLDDLYAISREALKHLRPGGLLLLEHGYDQAQAVGRELTTLGYGDIRHHPDLQGHYRVTSAHWV